jgi:hypothetical protein
MRWLRSHPAIAEKMDNEKYDSKDKQKMNERGSHMEHHKCPDPREKQYKRDCKKQKPH